MGIITTNSYNDKNIRRPLILTFILLCSLHSCMAAYNGKPQYKIRQIINYDLSFSEQSNVTLVFTTCQAITDLKQAVLSFFYYNTYPLKKVVLVDRCSTSVQGLQIALPQNNSHPSNLKWFSIVSFKGNEIEALQKAFEQVTTKYAINYPNKWITYGGIGFIQQALDVMQYGQQEKLKISQVTQLFLHWKNYRSLSKYRKTSSGTTFYEIRSFKPTQRYYFTFNPSLINIESVFKGVLQSNILNFCVEHHCQDIGLDCCQLEIGRVLFEKQFTQIFIDDGSVEANVFSNK